MFKNQKMAKNKDIMETTENFYFRINNVPENVAKTVIFDKIQEQLDSIGFKLVITSSKDGLSSAYFNQEILINLGKKVFFV